MSPGGKERESLILKHGLASIQKRREDGIPTEHEEQISERARCFPERDPTGFYCVRRMPMKSTSIFLSSGFSTTCRFFSFPLDSPARYTWSISSYHTEGGVSPYSSLD